MNSTPEHPDVEHLFQQLRDSDDAGAPLAPVPFAQIRAHVAALTPQQARDAVAYGDRVQLGVDAFALGMMHSEQGDLASAIRCFEIADRHGAPAAADQLKATSELRDALDEVDLPDDTALTFRTRAEAIDHTRTHELSAGVLNWADERAERIVADARDAATSVLDDARSTAARLIAEARAQADQIINAACPDEVATPMARETAGLECDRLTTVTIYGGEHRQKLWTPEMARNVRLGQAAYVKNGGVLSHFMTGPLSFTETCCGVDELMGLGRAVRTGTAGVVFTARDREQACERMTLLLSLPRRDWSARIPEWFGTQPPLSVPGLADDGRAVVLAVFDGSQEPVGDELLQQIRESIAYAA
ncbi:hypothetical protein [Lentzea sp. NPDC060358]|uniref:hypothetical protein n=1 Tax=Lentzea sp. NPDC060358 TaxID=3347103 RepID=UPI003663709E